MRTCKFSYKLLIDIQNLPVNVHFQQAVLHRWKFHVKIYHKWMVILCAQHILIYVDLKINYIIEIFQQKYSHFVCHHMHESDLVVYWAFKIISTNEPIFKIVLRLSI